MPAELMSQRITQTRTERTVRDVALIASPSSAILRKLATGVKIEANPAKPWAEAEATVLLRQAALLEGLEK